MGKKKIRINFFSRLQSKKSTPPSLDGGILMVAALGVSCGKVDRKNNDCINKSLCCINKLLHRICSDSYQEIANQDDIENIKSNKTENSGINSDKIAAEKERPYVITYEEFIDEIEKYIDDDDNKESLKSLITDYSINLDDQSDLSNVKRNIRTIFNDHINKDKMSNDIDITIFNKETDLKSKYDFSKTVFAPELIKEILIGCSSNMLKERNLKEEMQDEKRLKKYKRKVSYETDFLVSGYMRENLPLDEATSSWDVSNIVCNYYDDGISDEEYLKEKYNRGDKYTTRPPFSYEYSEIFFALIDRLLKNSREKI